MTVQENLKLRFVKLKELLMSWIHFIFWVSKVTDQKDPKDRLTAWFMSWVFEACFGTFMFAILFGNVVWPQWKAISTAGWDAYSLLLWGFMPFVCLAVFIMRLIDSAKQGYVRPF
jgi:hypothetical protein